MTTDLQMLEAIANKQAQIIAAACAAARMSDDVPLEMLSDVIESTIKSNERFEKRNLELMQVIEDIRTQLRRID